MNKEKSNPNKSSSYNVSIDIEGMEDTLEAFNDVLKTVKKITHCDDHDIRLACPDDEYPFCPVCRREDRE